MNRDVSSLSALQRPTRVRYGVLGFACALSMITYLDRVCIASAVTPMMDALGLQSAAQLDWAFAAFAFAYALFEIPSGWLGDMYGPRRTLIRIVLWWSVFTALTGMTGLIGGLTFLIVIRFLFGMGEAGAYPNITRALHNWFPFTERGFAQGAVWMAGRLMGGLTPLLWLLVVQGILLEPHRSRWRGNAEPAVRPGTALARDVLLVRSARRRLVPAVFAVVLQPTGAKGVGEPGGVGLDPGGTSRHRRRPCSRALDAPAPQPQSMGLVPDVLLRRVRLVFQHYLLAAFS